MSGPKCGEWSVESNLERERRIVAELHASIERVRSELDAVRSKWQFACKEFGEEFPGVPTADVERASNAADSDMLRATLQQLRNNLTSWRAELAEAESIHRIKAILAAIAVSRESERSGEIASKENAEEKAVNRKEKLSTLLSSLNPMLPDHDRVAIEALGKDALKKVDAVKFENILLELRRQIQTGNQKQVEREKSSAKAQALLDRLIGLEGPEVRRVSQELMRVQRGVVRFRSVLEAEVTAIAAAELAEEDKRYASRVLVEELKKLGYSTTAGMETVLVQGGELEFSKAELREYAVNFSVNSESGQFDVHLTRGADSSETVSSERRLRDHSMEELWCGDLASVLSTAAERGVLARIAKREKPGVFPVAVRRETDNRRGDRVTRVRSLRIPGSK